MKRSICLNMIVKNESAVIQRCLASVKSIIDYWVIVDTGSTDGTQRIIREYLQGIPGELHEKKWVDFAWNRNQALDLAKKKGDYLLLIDADEELVFDKSFAWPPLTKDYYCVSVRCAGDVFIHRELLIKNSLDWKWVGVLHEGLTSAQAKSYEILKGVVNFATQDGCRSNDPQKFLKDAAILEQALQDDPDNGRNRFYLAFSYDVGGNYASALKNYRKRANMNGGEEEKFYCLYRIAWLQEQLGMNPDAIIDNYWKAFCFRPSRAEPLFCLANFYLKLQHPRLGYIICRLAQSIPLSQDTVLVDRPVYTYRLLEQLADLSYLTGCYDDTYSIYNQLLKKKELPEDDRKKIEENRERLTSRRG
jgi:glycosyltransferase involved in cell wall biosynthesis